MRVETRKRFSKYVGLAFKIYIFFAVIMFIMGMVSGAYIALGAMT